MKKFFFLLLIFEGFSFLWKSSSGNKIHSNKIPLNREEHIRNFELKDLVTFEIPASSEYEFFDLVEEIPSQVNGIWFITSGIENDIDFTITDQTGSVVFEQNRKNEGTFQISPTVVGTYTFKFKNNRFKRD